MCISYIVVKKTQTLSKNRDANRTELFVLNTFQVPNWMSSNQLYFLFLKEIQKYGHPTELNLCCNFFVD